ncbi:unnamed protein product [Effrenium voratum]|nr:unnamed protein product [Effrenium voratum]
MKLELWNLFREDVRDLFELTTSNMNTYMVVGSLLVTCIIGFIFVGYQEFPMEPPWLLLIWNNTVFSAITFGILSVWLATHGSSSSNSAATKILTQAVRPPVPGLAEVRAAMRQQEQYEKSGVKNFFMPPAIVPGAKLGGLQEAESPRGSSAQQKREEIMAEASKRQLEKSEAAVKDWKAASSKRKQFAERTETRMTAAKLDTIEKDGSTEAANWLEGGAHATDDISQLLATVDGGPGKSAAQYSHFWMLRKVQRGYACFDAYARISLTVSAQQMMLVGAYYAIGLFMTKTDGWPAPTQNAATGWLSSATAAFAGAILYKLDLYVVKKQRRIVDAAIFCAPMMLTLAVHLAVIRDNNGRVGLRPCDQSIPAWMPWNLALLACALHLWWITILLKVSCPLKSRAGLPMSYRSSIYLDVFGWHSKRFRQNAASSLPKPVTVQATPSMSPDRCAAAAFKEAKRISRVLRQFGAPEIASHLSTEEAEDLHKMQVILEEDVKELEEHLNLPEYDAGDDFSDGSNGSWLQCWCEDGKGHAVLYWVDAHSGHVQFVQPSNGEIIDLARLGATIKDLQSRIDTSPRNQDAASVTAEALPFELMPESPDSEESSKNLPWKCIQRTCWMQISLWCFTMVVIFLDSDYHASRLAPADSYDRSSVKRVSVSSWPHGAFRPSALSCNPHGKKLLLSDQFEMYSGELMLEGKEDDLYQRTLPLRNVSLQQAIPTSDLRTPWKSVGYLHNRGQILLLDRDGRSIVGHSLRPGSTHIETHWPLSDSLPQKLEVIQPVEGRGAQICSSRGSGLMNMGWALYASTDSGQVVVLCPTAERVLQPLHMVVSLRRKQASMSIMKLVDSHTGRVKLQREKIIGVQKDVYEGVLWIMVSTTEGLTEIRAWDAAYGQVGRWWLPTGRRWAQGLCLLGPNQGLLMAAADDSGTAGNAELWRIIPKLGKRNVWKSELCEEVLCLVALICWYLMVIKEVSHALALHRGISAVASGPSRLEPRENPFTQVTHYRLTSISPMRRACSGMLLLYRLFAAVLLIYVGTVFLVYTVSVTDLILNAVALGIILEIDDLIFDALATTPGRHLVHHLEPLPMPSFPRWRGADVKSLSMSLLIPGLVCLVYFTMLAPMVENLREVAEQLCGGTHNFVWSVDKRGVTVMAATNLHRDRVADKLHAKAMEEMFQATDLLSETGFPGRNWTYAATVDSLDFLKAMTTLHEEDVIDITNPSCGNLADQDPPMLAVLRHTLGNESIEGCKDVQSYCNSVSAPVPGKGPDEGRGYVTRMVCSDTCGCGDPGGMFAYVQGCPYGDDRPCSTIPKFRDEIYQATCEERTPELLRQHEPWLSWVEVIRNWATAGGNLDGQEEALLLAQALYDHGCGFGENLTAQNVTWGNCHEWNEDFDWDFKTVAFFCPETCQCTAATRESSCPFPRGKGCDQLKDCVLQRQQYYCIGDPGVDRIQGGIGIAYSSADFAIVKLTLRRALVKLLGVPWRAVTVNIFFVEVYFDVWRTPLPGVDLDSVEQILMGVDKEQFLQAWNQQLAANQLSQLKVSVTYFQVASKGTDEEG